MFKEICILLVGVVLGSITLMPNIMMSASGEKQRVIASKIGLAASLTMIFGGVIGFFYNTIKLFGIGVVLQLLVLLRFFQISNNEKK